MTKVNIELERLGKDLKPFLFIERSTFHFFGGSKRAVLSLPLTPEQAAQIRLFLQD